MVRAGLGPAWSCAFANDLSPKKAASYRANFGGEELWVGDVHDVTSTMLPGRADLAWGSFPCQDLSLAGAGKGFGGARSSAFFGFMATIAALRLEGRAPKLLALENVCGALTSRGGEDFSAIGRALSEAGYRFGAMVIDAASFLPQSRPRLFIVAVDHGVDIPEDLAGHAPDPSWSPPALVLAQSRLDEDVRAGWLWWRLPAPRANVAPLDTLIERAPRNVAWRSEAETQALLDMMAPLHRERIAAIGRTGERRIGTVYRRIRSDKAGAKTQRAEARFDGLAGCLRTPAGGSSRQTVIEVEGASVRSRLISAREAARLMGLPDDYVLPERYNDAYRLAGDGVAVPVVRHLAKHLFEPLLAGGVAARPRLAG